MLVVAYKIFTTLVYCAAYNTPLVKCILQASYEKCGVQFLSFDVVGHPSDDVFHKYPECKSAPPLG